ncbi:tryptophan synthase subunit alpha [Ktedonospora formicarum]|uniref:Tryptophan synthase alpha chain n=1 Tax=Ktedonospora formicarum TaxID=2778364 RepID=A0A8J3I2F8_9CHLR|nr:tryptophan synthase subunit alpha [Ktedonospora formicarum]GHO45555.1 tryptophan synthase alpha chain [Ktedonospora formicarum]
METQAASGIAPGQRLTHAFERARSEGRGALIPYLMCGYPDEEQSIRIAQAIIDGGADIIELGLPFSDPLADGVAIQHAGHVALEGGMSIQGCMRVAARISSHNDTPLIFMGYYNPILAYGLQRFCEDARQSGICGLIIPDLPPDESEPLREATTHEGIALIFLVPPTIRDERIARIADLVSQGPGGFIYCVSRSGVTGSRRDLPPGLQSFIARIRGFTEEKHIPLAVGFGLSMPEHIQQVTQYAEGAIVASALVNLIDQHSPEEQPAAIKSYIRSLRGL